MNKTLFAVVLVLCLFVAPVYSWVENETIGRNITFDSGVGTTLYNFTGYVTLDTAALISAGKLAANCSDIRLYLSGSQLDYYVESCNTNNTAIWFRLPTIGGDPITIELYYNQSRATQSSAANVFNNTFTSVWLGDSFNDILDLNTLTPTGGNITLVNEPNNCVMGKCYKFTEAGAYMYKNTPVGIALTDTLGSTMAYAKFPTNVSGIYDIFGYGQSASNYRTRDLRCNIFASGSCSFTIYGNPTNPTAPYIDNSQKNLYIGSVTNSAYGEICVNSNCDMVGFGASADTGNQRLVFGNIVDLYAPTRIGTAGLPVYMDFLAVTKPGINLTRNHKQAFYLQTYSVSSELTPPSPPFVHNETITFGPIPAKMPQNDTFLINYSGVYSPNTPITYFLNITNGRAITNTTGSAANYTATESPGNYTFTAWAIDSAAIKSNYSISGVFEVCIHNYQCTGYVCQSNNISQCQGAIDLGCGYPYAGNLSDFNNNCSYVPPPTPESVTDLKTQTGVLLFGILIFFWLALLGMAFVFRNLSIAILCFIVGVFIGGILISQFSPLFGFLFLFTQTLIILVLGKFKK